MTTADFEAFVSHHGPALKRFAYVLCGDRGHAEDLVQEALVKTYRHWSRVTRLQRPEAYVRRIIVNDRHSWWRKRSNNEVPVPGIRDVAAPGDLSDGLGDRDAMWAALAGLPTRQRSVLVLRHYEQLEDAEIAELLQCSRSTVRSLAARGATRLRTALSMDHAVAEGTTRGRDA